MVRQQSILDGKSCFDPAEAASLKAAYDDALGKLLTHHAALGASEALARHIVQLGKLRAILGETISGHSDAQLLSFLARQALK